VRGAARGRAWVWRRCCLPGRQHFKIQSACGRKRTQQHAQKRERARFSTTANAQTLERE
jgi:hypothetical protein